MQSSDIIKLSWKGNVASSIFFVTPGVQPLSSRTHKQKNLVTISIIHAAGKQADLFHNKLPHREILNRAD